MVSEDILGWGGGGGNNEEFPVFWDNSIFLEIVNLNFQYDFLFSLFCKWNFPYKIYFHTKPFV